MVLLPVLPWYRDLIDTLIRTVGKFQEERKKEEGGESDDGIAKELFKYIFRNLFRPVLRKLTRKALYAWRRFRWLFLCAVKPSNFALSPPLLTLQFSQDRQSLPSGFMAT